jgi:hypothetical protein
MIVHPYTPTGSFSASEEALSHQKKAVRLLCVAKPFHGSISTSSTMVKDSSMV